MQRKWKIIGFIAGLVLAVCLSAAAGFAQSTNSGDIRGTVTDTTGALIPGVKVTVLDVDTGVSKDYVTNQDGVYDTSSIVAGSYKLTFARDGFEQLVRGPITLQVGNTTVNAQLKVGSASTQIVVDSDVPLLQTESGDQTATLDSKSMSQLPQVTQDWENFMILLPGTSGTPAGNAGSSNPGQIVSSNGNLPYNNVLADGASTSLSHSSNANPAIFETVDELQVSLSSFSAQFGIGGMIINQISKGGSSQFHGAGYDYIQNSGFDAYPYEFGTPAASLGPIPFLRYHNFGGAAGGPILKKRMFFFFDYDQILDHGSASAYNDIPTTAVMGGDFSGQRTLYDPTTETTAIDSAGITYPVRKSFASEYGSNEIPTGLFDTVAAKFQQFYPTPTNHISGGNFVPGTLNSDGVLQHNFYASIPQSTPYRKYFGRMDYDITPNNRLTASDTQSDTPVVYPNSVTACPIGCQTGDVDNNNAQISDVWNISASTINEARIGYTDQLNFFQDLALNKGYAASLGWQFAKADDFPAINFDNTYPYAWIQPSTNAIYKEHVFDPSDVVTMIRGKHILHFGGEFLLYRDDSTAWGNTNAGTMVFSGAYTQQWTTDATVCGTAHPGVACPDSTTGAEYADFLLGLANSWNASVTPEYGARLKSPQMFIQDDYKVRPNLTLNLGIRYQINHGWNEVHGNIDSFDPTVLNTGTNSLGGEWYSSTHTNGRSALEQNVFNTVLPRVGFSWLAHPNTTVRGGFGIYSYNWSLDTYGGGMGAPFGSSGSVSDSTNGRTPVVKLDSSGASLPYTAASTSSASFNGQNINYTQYHTPVPKIYQWNLAVQQELGPSVVAQVSYVASHGFNLNFPVDINQVPESELSSNDVADRPYPIYGQINGSTNNAVSNYNSLQASVTKRMTNGVSLSFNYVWSHFLDDQDSSGWGSREGPQQWQYAYSPSFNYGNSNFDVRNAFKGYAVYQLPFGKGKMFLNHNALLDEAVGGWELSGTIVLSTGNPFTLTTGGQTYEISGAQYPNRVPGVSIKPVNRTINNWYNPAAFSLPAVGTFGNVRRNSIYGPGIDQVNLSGSKSFSLPWEGIKLAIRADAQNAFNHPSFGVPPTSLSGAAGPGDPFTNSTNIHSTTVGGRSLQLGARVSF